MSQLIPFDFNSATSKLPAHIAAAFSVTGPSALTTGVNAGYGVISIKGKVFHIVRGDERTLITKPGEDDPAASIEVVILDANPRLSKVYYPSGYEEGSVEKPTCYSNDSVAPAEDAPEKQSVKCATCAHNQWGSRITDNGKKGKACADSRRMAVATVSQPNEPMLVRVPAASLGPLAEYGDMLQKRGVNFSAVVTKIGFDYTVAHPALTFKPTAFLDAETAAKVVESRGSDLVKKIINGGQIADQVAGEQKAQPEMASPTGTAPADAPTASPAPAAKPVAARTTKPKAEAAPATPPASTPEVSAEVASEVAALVSDLDFDV